MLRKDLLNVELQSFAASVLGTESNSTFYGKVNSSNSREYHKSDEGPKSNCLHALKFESYCKYQGLLGWPSKIIKPKWDVKIDFPQAAARICPRPTPIFTAGFSSPAKCY
jgi:hypothetical protein